MVGGNQAAVWGVGEPCGKQAFGVTAECLLFVGDLQRLRLAFRLPVPLLEQAEAAAAQQQGYRNFAAAAPRRRGGQQCGQRADARVVQVLPKGIESVVHGIKAA